MIRLFRFKDPRGYNGEIEANFIFPYKLVNLRIQLFFGGLFLGNRRASKFLKEELTPYVSSLCAFSTPLYNSMVRGTTFNGTGFVIALRKVPGLPSVSTWMTLEGYQ